MLTSHFMLPQCTVTNEQKDLRCVVFRLITIQYNEKQMWLFWARISDGAGHMEDANVKIM